MKRWIPAVILAGITACGSPALAPEAAPAAAPAPEPAARVVTIEELSDAITRYVDEDAALKGGYFLVYDTVAAKPLALTLDHVHKERLSHIGGQVYFACADFKDKNGKIYDLDVFMHGTSPETLRVTEVTVHKEEGVARYGWFEEAGVWKRKPAEPAAGR